MLGVSRLLSCRFSPLSAPRPAGPAPLQRFLKCPLTAPLPFTRFTARSAPFSTPLICSGSDNVVTPTRSFNLKRLLAVASG